jgi:chromosome segregation ATPase
MKTIKKIWFCGLVLSLFIVPLMVNGQVDKKASELKKLETAVNTAKTKVALNEKQLAIADSLISTGNQMIADSKAETKTVGTERKALDKEYAANQKPLLKQSSSKEKEEAAQAKTELKALDTKYKADVKALDTRLKDATKKSTTGNSNLSKGKAAKKTAETALKTSQAALDAANEKYDAATGSGDAPEEGKKKKK